MMCEFSFDKAVNKKKKTLNVKPKTIKLQKKI